MRPGRFHPGLYSWLALMISCISLPMVAVIASVKISERSLHESLCPIVVTADSGYRAHPPVTDVGKRQAEGMRKLRAQYRCDQEAR